ncbi:MAG: carboxymuconolactone decarboxylase family protein [Pigmentiphaga sp.]
MAYSTAKTKGVVPKLREVIDTTIYGDIWERAELSKRDRSLVTVAALIALRQGDQMPSHMRRAVENGVTAEEISEVITHLAFYVGCPAALSAAFAARPLMEELGFVEPDSQ